MAEKPGRHFQERVLETLGDFDLSKLKALFDDLNFISSNDPIDTSQWTERARGHIKGTPRIVAYAGKRSPYFAIVHIPMEKDRLLITEERTVVSQLIKQDGVPYGLYAFSDSSGSRWHLVNVRFDKKTEEKRKILQRVSLGKDEKRLRTVSERVSLLCLDDVNIPSARIQVKLDEAFDVEAVTTKFFEEYKGVYESLQDDLASQTRDKEWARDISLQILNRLMFVYYIQRKRWLGEDIEFLDSFWYAYQEQGKGNFFSDWLSILFFDAFNNRSKSPNCKHFPERIREVVRKAPYLNGGLFSRNEIDVKYDFTVSDDQFKQIFGFLESYNFTISEDSPLDTEVAVDPEMIGKVYESLVNIGTEEDLRGKSGTFYTPRVEIDLMCRLSLVDCISNYLPDISRKAIYEMVFAIEEEEKEEADKEVDWEKAHDVLSTITVLDPAVGSGSFLVGMLNVLNDLEERACRYLGIDETSYERKKRIIGTSLYGVDAKEWVCHVAELRLWLSLVVDTDFSTEELKARKEPLLPYFTFKIRHGDSLVQIIGDVDMNDIRVGTVPEDIQERIENLKQKKLLFYSAMNGSKKSTIENEEVKVFRDLLQDQITRKEIEIDNSKGLFEDGSVNEEAEFAEIQKRKLEDALDALKNPSDVPFVWDIAFVEIFEGEKRGFDIVLGNPPYVRHEKIADPLERIGEKEVYKEKVIGSAYASFPSFFEVVQSWTTKTGMKVRIGRPIIKNNDLYTYFYLKGLSLLNANGSFCFITSNSWLDAGYGKDLQEFLLRHCHIKIIMDNEAKRSFASADVNTVIVLLGPPLMDGSGFDHTARFVMFKVPFEDILPFGAVVFEEIEDKKERTATEEYRVFPIGQAELFEDGCE